MALRLPDAVTTYFSISNGGDPSRLAACFCTDATVTDERRTYAGLAAIEAWQRQAQQAFTYQVEPQAAVHDDDGLTVTAQVSGDFPGSPVQLQHRFTFRDERIHTLEIAP
ncbi:nuclear transport factor 2 family protein [Pseudomonas sp. GD03944]|uniref:nuclear transport factor 2 family protein n=1 Tax=Pseudomonas sp. GD03944 TaxID=2975409 RepID=UPI00244D6B95|nr:nuclear transport factor 2 family protein [Pseudomonas sp. GD03944]MDH1263295.1 nuclear transport factor 2 family protein [Pseudomonas sp. GD03944]